MSTAPTCPPLAKTRARGEHEQGTCIPGITIIIASVVDALELVSVLFCGADLGKLQSEQREAGLLVVLSAQVGGDLVDDEFGGRSDARGDQMPAAGCAVSRSEHNVGVDSGCAHRSKRAGEDYIVCLDRLAMPSGRAEFSIL